MGPAAKLTWDNASKEGREFLENAMHIAVPIEMMQRVMEVSDGLPDDVLLEGRLPAHTVIIEIGDDIPVFILLERDLSDDGDNVVAVSTVTGGDVEAERLCFYFCRALKIGLEGKLQRDAADELGLPMGTRNMVMVDHGLNETKAFLTAGLLCSRLDLLLMFINEPRFVKSEPQSRLKRNMQAKKMGQKALRHTWVKLGWTIGGKTRAKRDIAANGPMKAFHMVKGHYRYFDHQTKLSERAPGGMGWRVWIDVHYSGNPALGEVKHRYQPKLKDPGESSSTVHRLVAGLTADALKVAAERNAA